MSGRPLRLVVLGGGNGASAVLRGIAARIRSGEAIEVTAVVSTADDGGSTGRLRRDRGGLPVGDLRNCLLALASDPEGLLARLCAHRFDGGGDLAGHVFGNLLLSALAEAEGSYPRAVMTAAALLGARGRVLSATESGLHLAGETRDGRRLLGESTIGNAPCSIHRVWLEPAEAEMAPGVADAIRGADLVAVGPGSLFTSLLPVLLVPGVTEAVRQSHGARVLVANLMTQPGETLGLTRLEEHLEALDRHVGAGLVEYVLVPEGPVEYDRLRPYTAQGSEPVVRGAPWSRAERLVAADVLSASGKIRHDPDHTARALLELSASVRQMGRSLATGPVRPG